MALYVHLNQHAAPGVSVLLQVAALPLAKDGISIQ